MSITEYQRPAPQCDYLELRLDCPRQLEDELTWLLLEQGAEGIEVIDNMLVMQHLQAGDWDASVFDGQQLPTEYISLRTLLPCGEASRQAEAAIRAAVAERSGVSVSSRIVPPVDWQEKWKEGFVSRPVGLRLWIRPCWENEAIPAERIPVSVNPGLVFGTGDHPTTEMALQLLEELVQPGIKVLDLGCGSGVLGIAALKLGAQQAVGIDIDENCAKAVAEHLQLNNLSADRFRYYTGDVLHDTAVQELLHGEQAPLVMANINADVLKQLAPVLPSLVVPGGCVICSGVLRQYGEEVMEIMERNGLVVLRSMGRGEWCSFVVGNIPAGL